MRAGVLAGGAGKQQFYLLAAIASPNRLLKQVQPREPAKVLLQDFEIPVAGLVGIDCPAALMVAEIGKSSDVSADVDNHVARPENLIADLVFIQNNNWTEDVIRFETIPHTEVLDQRILPDPISIRRSASASHGILH